jgi:hypothetical protein
MNYDSLWHRLHLSLGCHTQSSRSQENISTWKRGRGSHSSQSRTLTITKRRMSSLHSK